MSTYALISHPHQLLLPVESNRGHRKSGKDMDNLGFYSVLTSVGDGKPLLPHVQINATDISSLRLYLDRVFYLSPPSAITVWISVNSASIVGPSCSY